MTKGDIYVDWMLKISSVTPIENWKTLDEDRRLRFLIMNIGASG